MRSAAPSLRAGLALSVALVVSGVLGAGLLRASPAAAEPTPIEETAMQVQYLEIVTAEVEDTCAALAATHGVAFGEPEPALGNARVAVLINGGRIGVRAPLADHDAPIVRPYMLVDDIEAATAAAQKAGATFAMTATEAPGHGTFAIYMLGGHQYGLWQQ